MAASAPVLVSLLMYLLIGIPCTLFPAGEGGSDDADAADAADAGPHLQ